MRMVIKNEAYQLPLARNLTGNSGFEYFSLMFMPRPVRSATRCAVLRALR